jgi:hypothetical protein
MELIRHWVGTMRPLARGGIVVLFVASCGVFRAKPAACFEFPSVADKVPAPGFLELSPVRPYRNYLAVIDVEPAGHHLSLSYSSNGDRVYRPLRVHEDGAGHPAIAVEYDRWVMVAPDRVRPMPPQVAALTHDVEAALHARCRSARDVELEYKGFGRRVTLQEILIRDADGTGTQRFGWFATVRVMMDESLTRILGDVDRTSGLGVIELPGGAQWLALPPGNGMRFALVDAGPRPLSAQIAAAAQRYDAGAPPQLPTAPLDDAAMLPPGHVSRVVAKVNVIDRRSWRAGVHDLVASLDLHDAVFGAGASADAELVESDAHYQLHATLTPQTPRAPAPGRTTARYAGTLTLHVESDHGHVWDRTYPASGPIELEGDTVVAPAGLVLPGASTPSPEADALHAKVQGATPDLVVEVSVGRQLYDDPRW